MAYFTSGDIFLPIAFKNGSFLFDSDSAHKKTEACGEMNRQIALVYALQVFCHGLKWPKGLLLRLFSYMYDMEVVEEEAFVKWKEDLNDTYPGKGKALFQVLEKTGVYNVEWNASTGL